MDQSYLVTLNRWCYGCMSNNDGQNLQTYYIQDEALQTIVQSDRIILCYLCQRVAQKAEQFIYNVQHSQIWLESRKEFSDTEIQSIKAIQGIHPLVNLSSSLPSKEDVISLSGTDEQEFYFEQVKLEFDDVDDTQNTTTQDQENISETIEQGCQNTAESTNEETHNCTASPEVQKLDHEDATEITERGCQDIVETTEQIYDDNTESPESHSNNIDVIDDTLSEGSLSDVNGQETEEENCIGQKIECILITEEEFREEMNQKAKKEQYLEAPFKCVDCVRHYRMKGTYERHMELHKESSGDHECSLCKQRKKTSEQLLYHEDQHLLRFKCCKCGLVGKCRPSVYNHYQRAHETRRDNYTCTICENVFSSKRSLHYHMKSKHLDQMSVKCDYCGKTFRNKYSLPPHLLRAHNDEVSGKLYTCEICGCSFIYKGKLTRHMQIHSEINDYYCVECDKKYKSEDQLEHHLKYAAAHVNVSDLLLSCPQCDRHFSNKRALQAHINIHDGVFNFQCAHCGKAFPAKGRLASHIYKVHLKNIPPRKLPCRFCDKVFKTNSILRHHIRTHTGETPFKCNKCSAEFSHPSTLYNHNKIVHLGLKRKRKTKGGQRRKRKIVRKSKTHPECSDSSD